MITDAAAGTEEDIIYTLLKQFQEGILLGTRILLHLVYCIMNKTGEF